MESLYYIHSPFQIHLTFYPVIESLEKKAEQSTGDRAAEARELLKKINESPELRSGITNVDQLNKNADIINRLLSDFFPADLALNEIKAISMPYQRVIFNHTERFKNILAAAGPGFELNIRDFDEHQSYVLSCCIILNEHYGTQLDFTKPLFADIPTAKGTIRHYRIMYNADFMEIFPTKKSVPLTQDDIDLLLDNYDNIDLWMEKFPKDSWILKGFAIMTLYDATIENAVSILKEKLLSSNVKGFRQSIESIFRSIYVSPNIRVGFTLFNREEYTFNVAPFGDPMQSFLLNGHEKIAKDVLCDNSYCTLIEQHHYFAVSDIVEFGRKFPDNPIATRFMAQNIQSFILAPVVKQGTLLGIFELVSSVPKELNSVNAHKLELVMPFLTDTADRLLTEYQNQVQAVIQTNYTTIHPSVYWKFQDEAHKYIRAQRQGKDYMLDSVLFEDVHPLYGQADIKGSSEARNYSIQKDLKRQLKALTTLLQQITLQNDELAFTEEQAKLDEILEILEYPIQANTEQYITDYLSHDIHPKLRKLQMPFLGEYLSETGKETGMFYHYRRKYEITVSLINSQLATSMDRRQKEAQQIYPHYYERFKTDGVEHNIYLGNSIAPNKPFGDEQLQQIRLWQLQTLCEMMREHQQLKPELPYPLDITGLILVYHGTISVCFRMDEKRFDVDGSYNARYEVVKKRIDKAHIKGSTKRITQPGTIAIVYSGQAEEDEYKSYISLLQSQNVLSYPTEELDVEDLQGVSGLKALRVNVIY
ncbi:GAF domain-containing protein [Mucilaginibacter lacusdianchii]|uniref:GAF domain-containing protein n=1 Tax=Mucilaginibacter lacusdianchii TaxID=2684211 RepID=UPI00131C34AE|nr:GAF domain-containing protein [Mucilaginibacter sp. JXJ CY 39]